MVKSAEGVFKLASKKAKSGYVWIPAKMVVDSAFPFEPGDKIEIEIDETMQALVIRKKREK